MIKYSFRRYQPLSFRLWHWLNAVVLFGLLGTVLLRKTFLSWHTNSALIEAKLNEAGNAITPELATTIMVLTGLLQYFKSELGLTKDLVGTIKEIHEVMMWFFVVFVSTHLFGVIVAENTKNPGIISDMINGGSPDHQKK